jgi:thiol-disulfide isomerase/thioredoxin
MRMVAAVALAAIALGMPHRVQSQLELGSKAPAAAVETLDGTAVNLSSFVGDKPVLIEFWATWCPNCKALEPQIAAAAKKYGDRVRFIAVAVSANQTPARVKAYAERNGLPMTFVFDRRGNATGAYDVFATSTIYVLDATGTVVYEGAGGDQNIEAAIAKAF